MTIVETTASSVGVGDVRHRVGRRDERVDPREPVRNAREPRGLEVDRVHGTRRRDEPRARERGEERAVTAAEVGEREWPGRQPACEERGKLARRRSGSRSRCTARSRERGYAPPGLQSPVSPSQQPTLNRQRGHWNVPCRHSMCAPQRMQISTITRTDSALTRSTLGLQEDGYDDPSRRRGRVVRQRPAKPRTAVRVRSAPSASDRDRQALDVARVVGQDVDARPR